MPPPAIDVRAVGCRVLHVSRVGLQTSAPFCGRFTHRPYWPTRRCSRLCLQRPPLREHRWTGSSLPVVRARGREAHGRLSGRKRQLLETSHRNVLWPRRRRALGLTVYARKTGFRPPCRGLDGDLRRRGAPARAASEARRRWRALAGFLELFMASPLSPGTSARRRGPCAPRLTAAVQIRRRFPRPSARAPRRLPASALRWLPVRGRT
jgi:hypothetical protein